MKTKFAYRVGAVGTALLLSLVAAVSPASAEPTADTGSIIGQLVDQHGVGVAYAEVAADGELGFWFTTTTDADGHYQLTGVVPDDYRVRFAPVDAPPQYAFGEHRWDWADLIPVAAGAEVVVDDQLLPTGILSGQFTDFTGAGLPVNVVTWSTGGSVHWTTSDGDGNWSMPVFAGQYRVEFEGEFEGTEFEQYAYGTLDPFDAALIDVAAGETVTVDDQLLGFGTITGQFTDADGDGLVAWVAAAPVDDGSWVSGHTDADGHFTLRVLPGAYRVEFSYGNLDQYAYGTVNWSQAEIFEVAAGGTVTVNDTLLERGTVTGQFTDADGMGISNVDVNLEPAGGTGEWPYTRTDSAGYYEVSAVPGDYYVRFDSWQHGIDQYAFGALSRAEAALITVPPSGAVTVDDTRLPTGSVRVTAEDAVTGEPLSGFSVEIAGRFGNTQDSELIISEVPVGTHEIGWVWAPGYVYRDVATVTVVAGERAELTLSLHPRARIETTVVDATTGEPLAGVCLIAASPAQFRLPEWCGPVSDEDGKVLVEVDEGGTYQLFAWPRDADGYGAQWVGRHGGSGDQRRADRVSVADGEAAAAPVVRMDLAGTITGTVTDPDGAPVSGGSVRIGNDGLQVGGGLGGTWTDQAGGYTLGGLGPYEWPLLFEAGPHAQQWSGGAVNRYRADAVAVAAGETTTYDHQMAIGTAVTISPDAPADAYYVVALNARTGDRVGVWWLDPNAESWTRSVLGAQPVKFQIYPYTGAPYYLGGEDLASARVFVIRPHGEQTLNLNRTRLF